MSGGPLAAAIAAWHDGLAAGAGASAAWLAERLEERGLFFGTRALCTVLRPRLLTPAQDRLIREAGTAIARAFARAHEAAVADPARLARFGLEDWERSLLEVDDRLPWPSPLGRLDAFFTADGTGLRFTEYNAETPAGAAYGDVLSELFLALPGGRGFQERFELRPVPGRPGHWHVLLAAWEAFSGRRTLPAIAIVDWREVPTQSEFRLFAEWFRTLGAAVSIVDPRELAFRGGRLAGPAGPIDLVYKRVLLSELVGREGPGTPLLAAVRAGAVCMVNPPRCKLLHKKASLAFLSDERHAPLFDAGQRATIRATVPWTRVVEERRTEYDGRAVDLLPFVAAARERFVLKPNDDYGGAGITLGWEVDQSAWEAALRRALEAPHIVQERIHLPSEPYPAWVDGALVVSDRIVDTAPYVLGGAVVEGCLSRISTASLVNVTAGGGSTVPTFVAVPR